MTLNEFGFDKMCSFGMEIRTLKDRYKISNNTMTDTTESLKIIKRSAIQVLPDGSVILFGSRAKKAALQDSDYDILIVVKKTLEPLAKFRYKAMLRKLLVKSGIRTDIFIESEEEVKIKSQLPGHIIKTAMAEGINL